MEIPRWLECMQDRDHPMGKKQTVFLILLSLDTSLTMMHIGGRCLDQIINRAWPFEIACGQWLALCWVLCLQASLPGLSCHRDHGEAQMFPLALPNFIVGLPVFTAAWYDLTSQTQHSCPLPAWLVLYTHQWRWGMSGLSDADAGCQLLIFLFTSAHTTRCSLKWPDILPYSEICSISVTHLCENSLSLRNQYLVQTLLFPWSG